MASMNDALRDKRKAIKGLGKAIAFHRDYHVVVLVEEMRAFKHCMAYPCRLINEGPELDVVLEGHYNG